jgi:hypothetical protein
MQVRHLRRTRNCVLPEVFVLLVLVLIVSDDAFFALNLIKVYQMGVGIGRVVIKVRQHPDDHEFEFQRWQ